MSKMTSKHRMPKAFVRALGIISVLAIVVAFAVQPSVPRRHRKIDCDTRAFAHHCLAECQNGTATTTPDPDPGTPTTPTTPTGDPGDMITSDSTTASGAPETHGDHRRCARRLWPWAPP